MTKAKDQPERGRTGRDGVNTLDPGGDAPPPAASVDREEVARFSAMAAEWWDPNGKFRPLHKFNPARLAYIRETLCNHFDLDASARQPFRGLSVLDIGCGGGLVSEPMAIMGAQMTGADASHQNIMTARTHAAEQGVEIDYRCQSAERLAADGARFDVVLNLEVIEHVADLGSFMTACGTMVKPGGLMIVATLNRTLKAFALAVVGAEYILGWLPRGTHQWDKFVTPRELDRALDAAGLKVLEHAGVSYNPIADRWSISDDTDVNYMAVALRPG